MAELREIEVTWGKALRFFWSWMWRQLLVTTVFLTIIGMLLVKLEVISSEESVTHGWYNWGGILLMCFFWIYFIKKNLSRRYKTWRVALVEYDGTSEKTEAL
ncbi:MAG: hypothetical protein KDD76_00075 [Rickettsiales bacterium]|nr:hypothetical protein [Rickettsiales bacterium]